MKRKRRWLTVIAVLLSVLLLLLNCLAVSTAHADEVKTLKVGYIDYHGFIEKDADGVFSGYAVEYLDEISKYTGYKYEYVYGEWSELLEMLESGELDLLCNAQFTDERAEKFDYCDYPIGYTQGLLYTRGNNDTYGYEDFLSFEGMTVGALSGSAMTDVFIKYAAQNGFNFVLREYETDAAMTNALSAGEVDAICSEHLANHTGLSLLASFGADAYYIISYKDSPYVSEIDFALQEIKTNVDFETELYHKYYDTSAAATTVLFTREEKQYIQGAPKIVVGLMPDRSPLSYETSGGVAAGMMVELMNLVAEKSGLEFEYKFLGSAQTGMDFLTNDGGDLVAGVAESVFSSPNSALLVSNTLQSASVVFVGREGMDFRTYASLTVALPAGFFNGEKTVSEQYPNFKFYKGTTNEDCLKAIRDGKADVMLQNLYIIRECLQSPLYDGLEIFPAFSFAEDEKVVALQKNALLMSIVNKSIDAITDEQQNNVVINNTVAKQYNAATSEIVYKYRFPLVGIAVLLLAVILLFMALAISRQRSYLAIGRVNAKLETTNGQLADAVVQADRASTAKSRFLSQMSHEIRTPMNAIVGLTEIARQHTTESEKVEEYLGKIAVSSKVLLNILNDVLDMSAIESGKMKIVSERFDIKQVLGGINEIYYPQCKGKGVAFVMATDVEDEYLMGDSLRLSQILLNFVSNAYKFTDEGGTIRVTVKETARREDTAFLCFTVSDTGCGMSEDMKKRLFKRFEQETGDVSKRHGGSGLGLSIAKNLIDMMHGAVKVESEKGVGTTFEIELPFAVAENNEKYSSDALKKLRVLAVDDDEFARSYTDTVLKRLGVRFEVAQSGSEALQMISGARSGGKPYDVVLVDWKMPDMDGLEVTHRIRESESGKPLIVIVSAYDTSEIMDEAKAAGADHVVTKPLFQSTVFNVLSGLTGGDLVKQQAQTVKYDFTGHKVLLCEDQDLNAEIAEELLALVNMASDRAENGKIAVDMFAGAKAGTYDAILMDVQMPVMDGYEAATTIRNLKRSDAKTIPIFAMTANAFTEDVSAALSAGMNGHIAKPIDTKKLYATLQHVVERGQLEKTEDKE